MSHQGGRPNFLLKYAPLPLKGVNNQPQPSNNSTVNPYGNQIPYPTRVSRFNANSSIDETTGIETTNSEPCDLNSSLDNIAKLCQRQQRRHNEDQAQIESVTTEKSRLRAQLDVAAGEIQQLHNINEKLKNSYQLLEKELKEVNHLYTDVKSAAADTAQILEEARKEKDSWLSNFEKLLKNHYEKREMHLRNEFQQIIDEKGFKLEAMRYEAEQLEIQYHATAKLRDEITSSREQIKQLNCVNDEKVTELNALRDKLVSIQEAVATYEDVKHSLDILIKERAAQQERYSVLEKQCISTNDALVDCTNYRNELEISANELNKKLEDESKKLIHSISEKQEMIQQLTSCQQMLEEKTNIMGDLSNQLSILTEKNENLDRKTREAEDTLVGQENLQLLIASLEKQVTELNCQLSEKTIEIRCKEERIEEMENMLKDLTLQAISVDQLTVSEERNRELQRKLNEKSEELEAIVVGRQNSERLKADLDKEVAELKCQLMKKSTELQYKADQLVEMENTLYDMTQKSLYTERAEICRSEVDIPRLKEKKEMDSLKTSLNLKNLELESISGEYEEAQKMISSAERKIDDLELTVSLLERRLETEREQASFSSQQPMIKTVTEPHTLRPILKQKFSDVKQDLTSQDKGDLPKSAVETLSLFQKANAIAKAEELKRRDSGSQVSLMIKPPPSPSNMSTPFEKRRRLDNADGSHLSSMKTDLRYCIETDSPILRNNSGAATSRFLARSTPTSNVNETFVHCSEDPDFDTEESF